MALKRAKSINFTIFFMRLLGLWYPINKNDKSISNLLLGFMLSITIAAAFIQFQELYFKRNNLVLLTYVAPCAVLVVSEVTKLSVFILKRKAVDILNEYADQNFWQKSYKNNEMKIVNKYENFCYKATIIFLIIIFATGSHFVFEPIIEIFLSDSMGKNISDRKLPFQIHFTRLVYESPYYQLTYICQAFCIFGIDLSAVTFASYLFVMNLYTSAQFRILGMRLRVLCDFVDDNDDNHQKTALKRLKEYVIEHQILVNFNDQMESIFCYVLLSQIFVSVSLISFSGLQILLSGWRILQQSLASLGFLVGSFVQLYLLCYSAYEVYASSESISQALYFMKWFRITDPKVSKDFTQIFRLFQLRASRPCVLTVGKLYPLTLESFSQVTKTSMSYFTVLRQIVK